MRKKKPIYIKENEEFLINNERFTWYISPQDGWTTVLNHIPHEYKYKAVEDETQTNLRQKRTTRSRTART